MEHLNDYADDRLVYGCIYCGGPEETREHAPSKVFLDSSFPENLPIVWACRQCNIGFSLDEEYVACMIECVVAGSTIPDAIRRPRVGNILRQSPQLQARIESAKRIVDGCIHFIPEVERVKNVLLKLARGHAVFDLSQVQRCDPDSFQWFALTTLTEEQREDFDAPHVVELWGEICSRGHQRLMHLLLPLHGAKDEEIPLPVTLCDWVVLQEGRYRYQATDDVEGIVVRIVIGEYLACEVAWSNS